MTDKENVDKNAKDAKGKKKEEVKLTEEDQKYTLNILVLHLF